MKITRVYENDLTCSMLTYLRLLRQLEALLTQNGQVSGVVTLMQLDFSFTYANDPDSLAIDPTFIRFGRLRENYLTLLKIPAQKEMEIEIQRSSLAHNYISSEAR